MFVKDTHRHPHKKLLQNKGKTKFPPPPTTTHNKILPNLVGKESFTSKHNVHKDLLENKASSPMTHKNENLANLTCFKNLPRQSVIGLCWKRRLHFLQSLTQICKRCSVTYSENLYWWPRTKLNPPNHNNTHHNSAPNATDFQFGFEKWISNAVE